MSEPTVHELVEAWSSAYAGLRQEEVDRRILGFAALVRGIAGRGWAEPEDLADQLGVGADEATGVLEGLAAAGLQVDAEGHIVGAALTTHATPHRLHVQGRDLYAWCALDTLFLPGLLGETAKVESTCPESGEPIHLTVTPSRFRDLEPAAAYVSVVDPRTLASRQLGPASPT